MERGENEVISCLLAVKNARYYFRECVLLRSFFF